MVMNYDVWNEYVKDDEVSLKNVKVNDGWIRRISGYGICWLSVGWNGNGDFNWG